MLLHLLRWLKTQVDWEMEVLINGGGPLVDEFRSVTRTTVWRNVSRLFAPFSRHASSRVREYLEGQYMNALMAGRHFDLVYANTCATWPQIRMLKKRNPVWLWHIHELPYGARVSISDDNVSNAFLAPARFIAVSKAVENALVGEFNVPRDKIDTVHGFVPFPSLTDEEQRLRRRRVRHELGWPEDAFVVGGCGSLGWRKGTDLFLQTAHLVSITKGYERTRFLWVGGEAQGEESLQFAHDAKHLGLSGLCSRIVNTPKVADYYCAMDLFVLTSREDPFPLVILEAGALGIPSGCFADSGGAPEFIGNDAGFIAPYLDTVVFARHIMRLYDTPDQRRALGATAAERVKNRFGVETQGPQLLQSIERCLSPTRKSSALPQPIEELRNRT